ncbi:MAG: sigma 54-interacting transcriptional regulator, partial [Tissierellales bacterium]|nr:sigma 54-interacting transcriptional regulator [Tissierellales bacterium]
MMIHIDKITKLILDSIYDGVLIINKDAVVQYVNPSYTRITGVTYEDIVEKKLQDVRPGARLPGVLVTGENVLRAMRMEDGIEYIVNMSAIKEESNIIGAISIVRAMGDVYELSQEITQYKKEINHLKNRIQSFNRAKYTFENIIAEDDISKAIKRLAEKISVKDTTVLITGESGTGKELYAQAIHNHSSRRNGPFVAINCAAINANLLESELFGYMEGSFTGASKEGKIGLFEAACEGTIFLDEISEMDYALQSKLMRILQEKTNRRIGGIKEIPIDVRVIAATNKNLEKMIEKGIFREDLYYRLSVFPLELPPLRERRGDILPIVRLKLQSKENDLMRRIDLTNEAKHFLYSYDWPGNIRELMNAVEFACNVMSDYTIDYSHLPMRIQSNYIKANQMEGVMEKLDEA